MKEIDLEGSVHELTEAYPELLDILRELGPFGVASTITRNTLGGVSTVRRQHSRHTLGTTSPFQPNSRFYK